MKCLRIYATPDGESHFGESDVPTTEAPLFPNEASFELSSHYAASRIRFVRTRYVEEVHRRADHRLLATSVWYGRAGGDFVVLGHFSVSGCPNPAPPFFTAGFLKAPKRACASKLRLTLRSSGRQKGLRPFAFRLAQTLKGTGK